LSGKVVAVNAALQDNVGAINADPYGQGWLVQVRLSDPGEADLLMDAEEYRATVKV
jgi:glycine cleavage system H protein